MKSKQIHTLVAANVAGGALLFSLIASLIWFYASFHKEVQRADTQIGQIVNTITTTASIGLYLNNKELLNEVINGLQNNSLIQSADFISHDKDSTTPPPDTTSLPSQGVSRSTELYHDLHFPMFSPFDDTENVGVLIIKPNRQFIEASAFSSAKLQALFLISYSILIALLTLFIVNRILTEPMKKMAEEFHAITPGDKTRITLSENNKKNEIGRLVNDINALLDEVNVQIDKERMLRDKTENLSQKFRLIFERASAGIGLLDPKNKLIVANPALLRLLGQTFIVNTPENAQGDFSEYFAQPHKIIEFIEDFWIKIGVQFCAIDIQLRHKAQSNDRWVHCLFSKVENPLNPEENLLEVVLYDITERAEREQHIIYEAEHDPLTLLLNRRASFNKLENLLFNADHEERHFAILMIDLDGFKFVNDTYGHDAGDKVIVEVAKRIKQFFRGSDVVTRWGGDEYLIGFSFSPTYQSAVSDIANDLQTQIALPIDIAHEQKAHIGSSIGISVFPQDDTTINGLIEKADEAMYAVKHHGKNNFYFYADISTINTFN